MDESLALLLEIFPSEPISELHLALKSSNGVLEDACAILTSDRDSRENIDHRDELKSMFPLIEVSTIDKVWRSQNGNFVHTVTELLSHHMLLEENITFKNKTKSNSRPPIDIVQEYTGVSTNIAQQFCYRNSFNVVKAIVSIVNSYKEPPFTKATFYEAHTRSSHGGRVQSSKGVAHSDKLATVSSLATEKNLSPDPLPYTYSIKSAEAQELESAIHSNLSLRSLYPGFLRRSLEYYKGDLLKTLQLAFLIIERDGVKYTYDAICDRVQKNLLGFTEYQRPDRDLQSPTSNDYSKECKSQFTLSDDSYTSIAKSMWSNVLTSPILDFHGFQCSDAIQVLQKCLERWWKYELDERELNNQKLFMIEAINIEPLKVITGRGIHSSSGVSKLKIQVRKFLEKSRHKYIEETAYFLVIGKKVR